MTALYTSLDIVHAQAPAPVIPTTVQGQIVYYANIYGSNSEQLTEVAKCESSLDPNAWNKTDPEGGSKGIFQFQPSTFLKYSKEIDVQNPDIWNSEQQIEVAAYMFSLKQQNQWSCWNIIRHLQ